MRNTLFAKGERAQALEWFRVMRPLGAFVLVFLEAQIKSTCISHNSLCIFPIQQCIIKQGSYTFDSLKFHDFP